MTNVWETEKDFLKAITSMEEIGVLVDQQMCHEQIRVGLQAMDESTNALGIEPKSHVALEALLIKQMGLPVLERSQKSGKPSFNKRAMEQYEEILEGRKGDDRTASTILRYRGWKQSIGLYYRAFLDKMSPQGRLHPNFRLHGTTTGRLSCTTPNLQQMPKHSSKEWNGSTKAVIVPDSGWELYEFDYSQLEFRLAAVYAQDENLLNVFNSELDIFDSMAEKLNWERNDVKTNTYLTLYGGGTKRRMTAFNIGFKEAEKMGNEFFKAYPKLKWIAETVNETAKRDQYIQYWSGRRRHFPNGYDAHKAFNSLLQGGGAEIVKAAICNLQREVCDEKCKMALTVHDSVVFAIKRGHLEDYREKIESVMERPVTPEMSAVSMKVEGKVWGS